ncbi:patatin-like phospholipase [Roseivirga pacifica]|uniref:Patatin-like phospholipase n=1 Tax=Roseivirga pacifica TaxID=1267423 RepID=A0A1I0RSH1_9BACT|nr:patatin-like phospholipase [Roseivirga pacifica]SEW44299.1 Patatin-like phospholipase [Roseivirga pacifica]
MKIIRSILNSFPIKLLLVHIKHNQFLLLYWVILFAIIDGRIGKSLGIPYLFLDPIYLDKVGFWGFLIMGVVLAGFAMSFNITSYILDGFRFPFLGTLPRPFTHYCLNNALLPLGFLIFYVVRIIGFQRDAALYSSTEILASVGGLLLGYAFMLMMLFSYFAITNRDMRTVLKRKAAKLPPKFSVQKRKSAFQQLRRLNKKPVKCDNYLSIKFRFFPTHRFEKYYDRVAILGIFKQNQSNAIIAEVFLLVVIFGLGIFQNTPVFQIPAGASAVLFFTIFVMATGALSYWLRSWVVSAVILLLVIANVYSSRYHTGYTFPAYGLDYKTEPTTYNLNKVNALVSEDAVRESKAYWIEMLQNWKAKTGQEKPNMVLVAVSGGGQRAALWTTTVLQHADSAMKGQLMDKTFLITGASGGLVGAAYFRDIYMQNVMVSDEQARVAISTELLNPMIFTLLINDFFLKVRNFEYAGQTYKKERGYTFEQNLSQNLGGLLDRPIADYREAEYSARIPKLLVAPLITNDGRKLYISPHPVGVFNEKRDQNAIVQGVDFRALLEEHQADSLRFLTALRMSATFPYITPTMTLPTEPPVQIADAGISDNYGVVDALIFLEAFKGWIKENTNEVVLLAVRDSKKSEELAAVKSQNIVERFFSPIQSVYKSWDKVQTIKNDQWYELVKASFGDQLQRVEIQYAADPEDRASLSWRLTELEKKDIIESIHRPVNQESLRKLERY